MGSVCDIGGGCKFPDQGIMCTDNMMCMSGYCVDSKCCNEVCNSECDECSTGYCLPTIGVQCDVMNKIDCQNTVKGWSGIDPTQVRRDGERDEEREGER